MKKARRVKKLIVVIALLTAMMMTACGKGSNRNDNVANGAKTSEPSSKLMTIPDEKSVSISDILFTDNDRASHFFPTNDPEFGNMAEDHRQWRLDEQELFDFITRGWPKDNIENETLVPLDINKTSFKNNDFGIHPDSVQQIKSGMTPKKIKVFFVKFLSEEERINYENCDGENPNCKYLGYLELVEPMYDNYYKEAEFRVYPTVVSKKFGFGFQLPVGIQVNLPLVVS